MSPSFAKNGLPRDESKTTFVLKLGSMKTNVRVLYAANEVLYAILEIALC